MSDQTNLVQLKIGRIVEGWKIEKKLGEGAFGAVYKCSKNDNFYALKVESANEKIQLLKMEVVVLMQLSKADSLRHFCNIEDRGHCENFNYVVMTLAGKSLQDLRFDMPKRKLSMGCAISAGIQCLEALEDLHSIGYLHRDIKPGNYTIGRAELNELRRIYLLDFGMARKFVHDDGTIKKPRAAAGFRGTVRYAALSCHVQRELCRKDDIESWVYMLVELTKGHLPWRNIEEQDEVGIFKKDCRKDPKSIKLLFGGCPKIYIDILRYSDSIKFFDQPDYAKIYKWLRDAIELTKSTEFPYDWEPDAKKVEDKGKKNNKVVENEEDIEESEKKKKSAEVLKKSAEVLKKSAEVLKKSAENISESKKKKKPGQSADDHHDKKGSPFVSPAVSPRNNHKDDTPDASAKKQKKKMVINVQKHEEDGPSEKNNKKSAESPFKNKK